MFAKALYVYIVYRELELYPIRSSNLNNLDEEQRYMYRIGWSHLMVLCIIFV